jgi:hypothetical protein
MEDKNALLDWEKRFRGEREDLILQTTARLGDATVSFHQARAEEAKTAGEMCTQHR